MRYMDWDAPEFSSLSVTEKMEAITASAAAFAYENGDGAVPEEASEVDAGSEFIIPLLIPEEVESGDGRQMEKDALSTRDLPIPLLWQPSTGDGHNGSFIVGRIDTIEKLENGLGNARGVFDTGPYGREAERLVRNKMLRGVSADLDKFEATVAGQDLAEEIDPSRITNEKMQVKSARVMAATLVSKPAFQECSIELVTEDTSMTDQIPVDDGIYEETPPAAAAAEYALSSLIASAAPVNPPSAWFANPELTGPTPLTVSDEGHVYGHIATWDVDHVGFNTGVRPPRSRSNYAYFRTGLLKTIEGEDVAVGQLTLLGGHAPLDASAQMAVKHYDDTASAVADVTAGEDQFGIWVSGGLRPHVTPEQVRVFRASAPSGDWRPINGVLELVACTQVNVPGFPVARARVASGSVMALVAAGTATLHKIRQSEHEELANRVGQLERMVLERRKQELSTGILEAKQARINRLREAAAQARSMIAPELDKREQAKAELAASAENARQRFNEFKLNVQPDFKEPLHPRDDEGKFRQVLLKLSEILKDGDAGPDAAGAKQDLEKAADLEEKGDVEGAKAAGEQAKGKLDKAATDADKAPGAPAAGGDPNMPAAGDALHEVVEDIEDAAGGAPTKPAVGGDEKPLPGEDKVVDGAKDVVKKVADKVGDAAKDIAKGDAPADGPKEPADSEVPADIPPEIKEFIDLMIDELGENADPKTILSRMDSKMKQWLEGKGFNSPEEMARVIEKMMQKPVQPDIIQ